MTEESGISCSESTSEVILDAKSVSIQENSKKTVDMNDNTKDVQSSRAGTSTFVCEHPLTIKDLCGVCGRDLREKGGFPGQRVEQISANVSMIHHVPELLVSNKLSKEIGTKDREILLKGRKLALMVDLDQTLIHTANRPPKPAEYSPSTVGYRIYNSVYYTKIRPHAREFLDRVSSFYEMHIVTFGQRQYAHKIADILDPEGKYFQKRILSRDELISSVHKTRNLKALFPVGDEMLVMIDDRPDVWQYSDALIRVKPYRYFMEIGDINAPPPNLLSKTNGDKKSRNVTSQDQSQSNSNKKGGEDVENKQEASSSEENKEENAVAPTNSPEEENAESLCPPTSTTNDLSNPVPTIPDDDDTLVHIERILIDIHAQFFKHFDEDGKVKDVKQVIARLRQQVLSGERLVFTGLIPREVDPKMHWLYKTCSQFGARVDTQVSQSTSIVIAGRPGTDKIHLAKKLGIPVVTQEWLYACFHKWQRVDEKDYLRMSNEVDDALSEDDNEDEEDDDDNSPNNSSSSDFDEMAADIESQLNSGLMQKVSKSINATMCCGRKYVNFNYRCLSSMLQVNDTTSFQPSTLSSNKPDQNFAFDERFDPLAGQSDTFNASLAAGKFELRFLLPINQLESISEDYMQEMLKRNDVELSKLEFGKPDAVLKVVCHQKNLKSTLERILPKITAEGSYTDLLVQRQRLSLRLGKKDVRAFSRCCPNSTDVIFRMHVQLDNLPKLIEKFASLMAPIEGLQEPFNPRPRLFYRDGVLHSPLEEVPFNVSFPIDLLPAILGEDKSVEEVFILEVRSPFPRQLKYLACLLKQSMEKSEIGKAYLSDSQEGFNL
uniref:RNA polymerase II subunit A C-terminal domain phosphatase n=2 Tax=Ditylenchus dipsaci TaxID=166011 RepID=A0A915D1Z3_9BILA